MSSEKCAVKNCSSEAVVEVILYDVYQIGKVFFERDHTCSFLCQNHMLQNEAEANGERKPRGFVKYPYSNQMGAQGFTIYRPLV